MWTNHGDPFAGPLVSSNVAVRVLFVFLPEYKPMQRRKTTALTLLAVPGRQHKQCLEQSLSKRRSWWRKVLPQSFFRSSSREPNLAMTPNCKRWREKMHNLYDYIHIHTYTQNHSHAHTHIHADAQEHTHRHPNRQILRHREEIRIQYF